MSQEGLGHNSRDFFKVLEDLLTGILFNLRVTLHRLSTTGSSGGSSLLRCQEEAVGIVLVQCVFRSLLAKYYKKREFYLTIGLELRDLLPKKFNLNEMILRISELKYLALGS